MRELDSRHVDTDGGRYVATLWWDDERDRVYLAAERGGIEFARIRIRPRDAGAALRHPTIFLRDHITETRRGQA